jgi:very-short-patch-repair endonuclease
VIVETDGRQTHETPTAFQSDRRRDQFLAAAGSRTASYFLPRRMET